jgi:hypothetical protein
VAGHGEAVGRASSDGWRPARFYTATETRLHRHVAATPPEQEGNAGLLDHLPIMEVDLNLLPADRLRRFLEAFRVEIHYDLRTGRATFKAEISAETVNQLAQQASRADAALWQAAAGTHDVRVATNEEGPAKPGGSRMIKGSSFSKRVIHSTAVNGSGDGILDQLVMCRK